MKCAWKILWGLKKSLKTVPLPSIILAKCLHEKNMHESADMRVCFVKLWTEVWNEETREIKESFLYTLNRSRDWHKKYLK